VVREYLTPRAAARQAETSEFVGLLDPAAGMTGLQSVTLGPDGKLYVASEMTDSVLRFDSTTYTYIDTFVASGSGGLDGPTGLVFDADGNLLVGSFENDRVLKYARESGAFLGVFAESDGALDGPDIGMTFGPDGHLYVPSFWNDCVVRLEGRTGALLSTLHPDEADDPDADEEAVRLFGRFATADGQAPSEDSAQRSSGAPAASDAAAESSGRNPAPLDWMSAAPDLNGDGKVDRADVGMLVAALHTCPGDTGYVAAAGRLAGGPCVTKRDLRAMLMHVRKAKM
jgi:hypothetical protein